MIISFGKAGFGGGEIEKTGIKIHNSTCALIRTIVSPVMTVHVSRHVRMCRPTHTYVCRVSCYQLTMPKFTLHLFCYVTKKHYIKKDVLLKGLTSKGCFTEKLYIRSQR